MYFFPKLSEAEMLRPNNYHNFHGICLGFPKISDTVPASASEWQVVFISNKKYLRSAYYAQLYV